MSIIVDLLINVVLLIVSIAVIYFGQKLIFASAQKRLSDKQKLIAYRKRLQAAVEKLLVKANEIDLRSRFQANKPDGSWSKQLADACNQLVGLSSALKELEADGEEPDKAKNNLLRAVVVAQAIESSLRQLEGLLSLDVVHTENNR